MTVEKYRELEEEFASRTDALCENKPSFDCDCSKCPCQDLCDLLCKEDPFA